MPTADQLLALREQLLVGVCPEMPPLDLLAEASRRGLYLIVVLPATTPDLSAAIAQLARWPAVMMGVIEGGEELPAQLALAAPNLLLAQAISWPSSGAIQPAPWASAALVSLSDSQQVERFSIPHLPVPVLVGRKEPGPLDAAAARAACDRLQGDLAVKGQFAGYLATFPHSPAGFNH
jgi:hypothetical protein